MAIRTTKTYAKNEAGELVEITGLINEGSSTSSEPFTVNGIERTPENGVVKLAANALYVLQGTLNGRVVIGEPTDTLSDNPTLVILDNVNITTDSAENSAIEYAPETDRMLVTVAANSVNRIACTHAAAMADSQKGAIHSGNQLVIQGAGYLSIINRGGHGVKASELRISGNPHIYVEAEHDGFHGNNIIAITGGVMAVNGSNDAFGTRAATDDKPAGFIWIFGGEYFAHNIKQLVFDSKAQGLIFAKQETWNTKDNAANTDATGITLHTDVPAARQYGNIVNYTKAMFGDAEVTGATLQDGYYVADGTSASVSGLVSNGFVFPATSSDITLNNCYIEVENANAILYTPTSKNIKVTAAKDTVNIIRVKGEGYSCIKSSNNIAFEPKSFGFIVLISDNSNAVEGSEVTIRDGFGAIVVQRGAIVGSQIIFGESGKIFGGGVNADIIEARLSSKGQKGNLNSLRGINLGSAYCNKLIAAGSSVIADYGVSYKECQCSSIDDAGRAREPYDYIPYNSPVTFV